MQTCIDRQNNVFRCFNDTSRKNSMGDRSYLQGALVEVDSHRKRSMPEGVREMYEQKETSG